jgi:hypothetical protein
VDNPEEENQRVLNEMIYRDDQILKDVLNPLSLYKHSPELFEVWLAMQRFHRFEEEKAKFEAEQAAMMGPPPMGPPGPGGPPGPPGAPPMPGVPPGMLPAPMGPEMFDPMMQAQMSAAGGVGMEAPPGISGIGGQIPGGMIPR